jgi:hypothetical protein
MGDWDSISAHARSRGASWYENADAGVYGPVCGPLEADGIDDAGDTICWLNMDMSVDIDRG